MGALQTADLLAKFHWERKREPPVVGDRGSRCIWGNGWHCPLVRLFHVRDVLYSF
jgi:hypothetical protein